MENRKTHIWKILLPHFRTCLNNMCPLFIFMSLILCGVHNPLPSASGTSQLHAPEHASLLTLDRSHAPPPDCAAVTVLWIYPGNEGGGGVVRPTFCYVAGLGFKSRDCVFPTSVIRILTNVVEKLVQSHIPYIINRNITHLFINIS